MAGNNRRVASLITAGVPRGRAHDCKYIDNRPTTDLSNLNSTPGNGDPPGRQIHAT